MDCFQRLYFLFIVCVCVCIWPRNEPWCHVVSSDDSWRPRACFLSHGHYVCTTALCTELYLCIVLLFSGLWTFLPPDNSFYIWQIQLWCDDSRLLFRQRLKLWTFVLFVSGLWTFSTSCTLFNFISVFPFQPVAPVVLSLPNCFLWMFSVMIPMLPFQKSVQELKFKTLKQKTNCVFLLSCILLNLNLKSSVILAFHLVE